MQELYPHTMRRIDALFSANRNNKVITARSIVTNFQGIAGQALRPEGLETFIIAQVRLVHAFVPPRLACSPLAHAICPPLSALPSGLTCR